MEGERLWKEMLVSMVFKATQHLPNNLELSKELNWHEASTAFSSFSSLKRSNICF
jgi:hypothetical protein